MEVFGVLFRDSQLRLNGFLSVGRVTKHMTNKKFIRVKGHRNSCEPGLSVCMFYGCVCEVSVSLLNSTSVCVSDVFCRCFMNNVTPGHNSPSLSHSIVCVVWEFRVSRCVWTQNKATSIRIHTHGSDLRSVLRCSVLIRLSVTLYLWTDTTQNSRDAGENSTLLRWLLCLTICDCVILSVVCLLYCLYETQQPFETQEVYDRPAQHLHEEEWY